MGPSFGPSLGRRDTRPARFPLRGQESVLAQGMDVEGKVTAQRHRKEVLVAADLCGSIEVVAWDRRHGGVAALDGGGSGGGGGMRWGGDGDQPRNGPRGHYSAFC
jgi:hypothetical protein